MNRNILRSGLFAALAVPLAVTAYVRFLEPASDLGDRTPDNVTHEVKNDIEQDDDRGYFNFEMRQLIAEGRLPADYSVFSLFADQIKDQPDLEDLLMNYVGRGNTGENLYATVNMSAPEGWTLDIQTNFFNKDVGFDEIIGPRGNIHQFDFTVVPPGRMRGYRLEARGSLFNPARGTFSNYYPTETCSNLSAQTGSSADAVDAVYSAYLLELPQYAHTPVEIWARETATGRWVSLTGEADWSLQPQKDFGMARSSPLANGDVEPCAARPKELSPVPNGE